MLHGSLHTILPCILLRAFVFRNSGSSDSTGQRQVAETHDASGEPAVGGRSLQRLTSSRWNVRAVRWGFGGMRAPFRTWQAIERPAIVMMRAGARMRTKPVGDSNTGELISRARKGCRLVGMMMQTRGDGTSVFEGRRAPDDIRLSVTSVESRDHVFTLLRP